MLVALLVLKNLIQNLSYLYTFKTILDCFLKTKLTEKTYLVFLTSLFLLFLSQE